MNRYIVLFLFCLSSINAAAIFAQTQYTRHDYHYCTEADTCAGVSPANCPGQGMICPTAALCVVTPLCNWTRTVACNGPDLNGCSYHPTAYQGLLGGDCEGLCSFVVWNTCQCKCTQNPNHIVGALHNTADCFNYQIGG